MDRSRSGIRARSSTWAQLAPAGRAPKVRFDGTRFWVAWIDPIAALVQITQLQEDLTFSTVSLAGWPVPSDAGFELFRIGDTVYLAVLVADALWLLETCP